MEDVRLQLDILWESSPGSCFQLWLLLIILPPCDALSACSSLGWLDARLEVLWHCSGLVALACAVPVLLGRVAAARLAGEIHLVTLLWRLYMSRLSIFNSNPVGFLDHDILTLRFWLAEVHPGPLPLHTQLSRNIPSTKIETKHFFRPEWKLSRPCTLTSKRMRWTRSRCQGCTAITQGLSLNHPHQAPADILLRHPGNISNYRPSRKFILVPEWSIKKVSVTVCQFLKSSAHNKCQEKFVDKVL